VLQRHERKIQKMDFNERWIEKEQSLSETTLTMVESFPEVSFYRLKRIQISFTTAKGKQFSLMLCLADF